MRSPVDLKLSRTVAGAPSISRRLPIWIQTSLFSVFWAQCTALLPAAEKTFADMSIEQLMNESVTSVSGKEQRLGDAPAAIAVLSNEDLRRSGATTIRQALRLLPGLNVAQVNSSQWAVSARGFNSAFSNKLLVLVDGRPIYSPLFAGVFWDVQQPMLDDVDRVEVIRGPGATLWGANAVNGVINVVSRSARDTQGGLLYGGGGDQPELTGGVRFGGAIGPKTYYRVFSSYRRDGEFPLANGTGAGDAWDGRHGGFRIDHYASTNDHLTWQADATGVKLDGDVSRAKSVNTIGRWTRQLADRSTVEVQASYDRMSRHEIARADTRSSTADFSTQHTFGLGAQNNIIWGAGYRHIHNTLGQTTPLIQVRATDFKQELFSAFLQDELQFIPDRLTLTVGGKLEHNDYTGWEFQPSLRAMFKPTARSTVWAAVSRAVRTPAVVEGRDSLGFTIGAPFRGPDGGSYIPTIVGNTQFGAEELRAYEIGFRLQPSRHASVDLAFFYNDYRKLSGLGEIARFVPGTPFGLAEIPISNLLRGETYGAEASVTVSPTDHWRLTANYSRLTMHLRGAVVSLVESAPSAPSHQAVLRSSHDFSWRTSLDFQLRHVSSLPDVRAYTTADFRLAYRLTAQVELSLVGQNLLDRQHPEQGPQQATVTAEVPRTFFGRVTWRF